jgi:hypothetical protein
MVWYILKSGLSISWALSYSWNSNQQIIQQEWKYTKSRAPGHWEAHEFAFGNNRPLKGTWVRHRCSIALLKNCTKSGVKLKILITLNLSLLFPECKNSLLLSWLIITQGFSTSIWKVTQMYHNADNIYLVITLQISTLTERYKDENN